MNIFPINILLFVAVVVVIVVIIVIAVSSDPRRMGIGRAPSSNQSGVQFIALARRTEEAKLQRK